MAVFIKLFLRVRANVDDLSDQIKPQDRADEGRSGDETVEGFVETFLPRFRLRSVTAQQVRCGCVLAFA